MTVPFELGEINSSAAYRLARDVLIPRLRAEVFPTIGPEPFNLRDKIYELLADEVAKGHLTQAQLDSTARVSSAGTNTSLASQTRFYALSLLKDAGDILSSDVRGMFVLTDAAAEQEAVEEAEQQGQPLSGAIYAYTFPSLHETMIKVGKAAGDVQERIYQQLGTANPEAPIVLRVWAEANIGVMETAIHAILKARHKWVEGPRAKEWFKTTVDEVDDIIRFVKSGKS